MARPSGVYVKGLNEVVKSLSKFEGATADLKQAFGKVSANVVQKATGIVPRQSGRLAESIKPSKTKNKAVIRAGSARVPYAGVINYGWPKRNIEASNFLTGPANESQSETVQILDRELAHLITKYGLK